MGNGVQGCQAGGSPSKTIWSRGRWAQLPQGLWPQATSTTLPCTLDPQGGWGLCPCAHVMHQPLQSAPFVSQTVPVQDLMVSWSHLNNPCCRKGSAQPCSPGQPPYLHQGGAQLCRQLEGPVSRRGG